MIDREKIKIYFLTLCRNKVIFLQKFQFTFCQKKKKKKKKFNKNN